MKEKMGFPKNTADEVVIETMNKHIKKQEQAEEDDMLIRKIYPLGYYNFPFCNKFAVATKDGKNYCKEHK